MAAMPQPGDRYDRAFTVESGPCWMMAYDRRQPEAFDAASLF
jgi:hypothetical protein